MRKDFVLDNKLYFDKDCSNYDDNPHNLRVLLSSKNPYVYNEKLYNFRIHKKLMTQSKNPRIIGMIDAVRIMNEILEEKNVYLEYQKWFVPYKIHVLSFAWGLLPNNLREDYFNRIPKLFKPGDTSHFQDDEVLSYFEMSSIEQIRRVQNMLSMNCKQFLKEDYKNKIKIMHSYMLKRHNFSIKENAKRVLAGHPKLYNAAKKLYLRTK